VQLDFDKTTRKATKIDVTTNMWQAEATERALEAGGRTARGSDVRNDTARVRDSQSVSSEEVRHAQQKLNDLGYQTGQPDGVFGPRTQEALRNFQKAKNIAVTGQLDEKTTTALGLK